MTGVKRAYTLSEKSWRRSVGQGMWIGSCFGDHGRTMQIVKIGRRYKDGNQWVLDIEAEECEKNNAAGAAQDR